MFDIYVFRRVVCDIQRHVPDQRVVLADLQYQSLAFRGIGDGQHYQLAHAGKQIAKPWGHLMGYVLRLDSPACLWTWDNPSFEPARSYDDKRIFFGPI